MANRMSEFTVKMDLPNGAPKGMSVSVPIKNGQSPKHPAVLKEAQRQFALQGITMSNTAIRQTQIRMLPKIK